MEQRRKNQKTAAAMPTAVAATDNRAMSHESRTTVGDTVIGRARVSFTAISFTAEKECLSAANAHRSI
jgi:hypothetical protein